MKIKIFLAMALVSFFNKAQASELNDALLEQKQGAIHNIALSDLSSVTPSEGTLTAPQATPINIESTTSSEERFKIYKCRMRKRVCIGIGLGIALAAAGSIGAFIRYWMEKNDNTEQPQPVLSDCLDPEQNFLMPKQPWGVTAENCSACASHIYPKATLTQMAFTEDPPSTLVMYQLIERALNPTCGNNTKYCITTIGEQVAVPHDDLSWYQDYYSDGCKANVTAHSSQHSQPKNNLKKRHRATLAKIAYSKAHSKPSPTKFSSSQHNKRSQKNKQRLIHQPRKN